MSDEPMEIAPGDVGEVQAGVLSAASARDKELAKRIEAAMSKAVYQAIEEGVSLDDSDEIRARQLAARQAVLDEHYGRTAAPAPAEG